METIGIIGFIVGVILENIGVILGLYYPNNQSKGHSF